MSRRGLLLDLDGCTVEAYRFPEDRRLRGLRRIAGHDEAAAMWQRWLDGSGRKARIDTQSLRRRLYRYVPEQKWIARWRALDPQAADEASAKLKVVVRAAPPRVCEDLIRRHRRIAKLLRPHRQAFQIPKIIGGEPHEGLLALRWLRGVPLVEALSAGPPAPLLERVVELLQAFHGMAENAPPELERVTRRRLIARIQAAVHDLSAVCPNRRDDLRQLSDRVGVQLQASPESAPVVLHNDFHWNQIRVWESRLHLLDLERVCVGDPLIDVANFATQLRMLAVRGIPGVNSDDAEAWAADFLQAYARRTGQAIDPARFRCYAVLSLLELARGRVRHLHSDWFDLTQYCIDAAMRQEDLLPQEALAS